MSENKIIRAEIEDILIKMEEVGFLLKDGKQILAYNKLNGIKHKLGLLYKKFEGNSEKDQNG